MTFDESYFQTMAQVIPVFWILLMVEYRLGARTGSSAVEQIFAVLSVQVSLIGEVMALGQMTEQHPSRAQGMVVFICAIVLVNIAAQFIMWSMKLKLVATLANVIFAGMSFWVMYDVVVK